jgi:hypothetical protein
MSRLVPSAIVIGLAALLGGCAYAAQPVTGYIYSEVKGPLQATHGAKPLKEGRATCSSILGWFGSGDASIEAAMRNGGITRLHHVDTQTYSILGCYATFTTVVWGDDMPLAEGAGGPGEREPAKTGEGGEKEPAKTGEGGK